MQPYVVVQVRHLITKITTTFKETGLYFIMLSNIHRLSAVVANNL